MSETQKAFEFLHDVAAMMPHDAVEARWMINLIINPRGPAYLYKTFLRNVNFRNATLAAKARLMEVETSVSAA